MKRIINVKIDEEFGISSSSIPTFTQLDSNTHFIELEFSKELEFEKLQAILYFKKSNKEIINIKLETLQQITDIPIPSNALDIVGTVLVEIVLKNIEKDEILTVNELAKFYVKPTIAGLNQETKLGLYEVYIWVASKLAKLINIKLTGAVSGNVEFDGSSNVEIKTVLDTKDLVLNGGYTGTGQDLKDEIDEVMEIKVDKVEGKSLISDDEVERLKTLDNYDDSGVKTSIGNIEKTLPLKADLVNGRIPSSQLPDSVDQIIEVNTFEELPTVGEEDKIYIVLSGKSANKVYRWSGTIYTVVSDTIALGDTAETAFAGNRGKNLEDNAIKSVEESNDENGNKAYTLVKNNGEALKTMILQKGDKGDRGDDGINGYQYAFEVIDGNLIMTYQDYTPQPNLYIDENGNLILEVNNG